MRLGQLAWVLSAALLVHGTQPGISFKTSLCMGVFAARSVQHSMLDLHSVEPRVDALAAAGHLLPLCSPSYCWM